jgi:cytochrome b561
MTPAATGFSPVQRLLHWLMAAMILAMLFIGIGMVSTVAPRYSALVAIHEPLGIAVLLLALLRLAVRLRRGTPPLPADLPKPQRLAARAVHWMLYGLMIAMPLIGWSMLSAAGYPIVLWGPLHLPQILPHDAQLHAVLRGAHTVLALLLFGIFLLHLAAALFHAWIRRDGVFSSMAPWPDGAAPSRGDGEA